MSELLEGAVYSLVVNVALEYVCKSDLEGV